jgi:hypothetical protein
MRTGLKSKARHLTLPRASASSFSFHIATRLNVFGGSLAGTDWKFSASGSRNPKRKVFFFAAENKSAFI